MKQRLLSSLVCLLLSGIGCSDEGDEATPDAGGRGAGAEDDDSGQPVELDPTLDTDGDGVPDRLERFSGPRDTDGDGIWDHEDPDDDGDGILTKDELGRDTDGDGIPDYLDADDDGDGVLTKDELADGGLADDDGDGIPNYLDRDVPEVAEPEDAGPPEECAQTKREADLRKKPVDIVFIVDNSSSMDSEIKAVQRSIDADFAQLIGASGIDYRVIMLADFGHWNGNARSVCISGALNPSQTCPMDVANTVYGQAPLSSERFYHYDPDGDTHSKNSSVGSKNSLCRALEWYGKPDGFDLAPQGWGQWLRPDAAKVFLEITDDHANCSVDYDGVAGVDFVADESDDGDPVAIASAFDRALRELDAAQFGTESARNYVFHSIISMPYKMDMPEAPYEASEPLQGANCSSGDRPGRAYEALSRLSDGLRFPVCAADDAAEDESLDGFKAVFQRIAQGVVEGSKVACDFPVPDAPAGKTLDRDTVEVVYAPATGDPVSFRKVDGADRCDTLDGNFYFEGDTIQLCPSTCTRVQADDEAEVEVRFGCELPPPPPPPPPPGGPQNPQ